MIDWYPHALGDGTSHTLEYGTSLTHVDGASLTLVDGASHALGDMRLGMKHSMRLCELCILDCSMTTFMIFLMLLEFN